MENISLIPIDSCTGCGACLQICPKHCIIMEEQEDGFLFPVVDTDVCVSCGKCLRACPAKKHLPARFLWNLMWLTTMMTKSGRKVRRVVSFTNWQMGIGQKWRCLWCCLR